MIRFAPSHCDYRDKLGHPQFKKWMPVVRNTELAQYCLLEVFQEPVHLCCRIQLLALRQRLSNGLLLKD